VLQTQREEVLHLLKGNQDSSGMFWGILHLVRFATGNAIGKLAQVHGLRKTILYPSLTPETPTTPEPGERS
jgi:hypothetical protein